jgi:hypothetical protein
LANLKETEKARRFTWESEQRAMFAQLQDENERKFRTMQDENERKFRIMQEEINSLKEYIRHLESTSATVSTASQNSVSEIPHESPPFQDLPQEHRSLPNQDSSYPLFVQGSSTDPTPCQANAVLESIASTDDNPTPYSRKRTSSPSSGVDDSSEDEESGIISRPTKRINGHDNRCLTVQVYMG